MSQIVNRPILDRVELAATNVAGKKLLTSVTGGEHAVLANMGLPVPTVASAAGGAGAGAAGAGGFSFATLGILGATAALSAGLSQIDAYQKRKLMKNFYHEELAARLGKSGKEIGIKDLESLAPDNRIIAEELSKIRKERNLNIGLSMISSLAALAVTGITAGLIPEVFGVVGHFVAQAAIGLTAYHGVKETLHWIGDKVMGVRRQTTHEKIVSLAKDREQGREITREQVFSVIVSANHELNDLIREKFGKSYHRLKLAQRKEITDSVGKLMHVDALAAGINSGRINVSEMAFAALGEASGVAPKEVDSPMPHQEGWVGAIKEKWHDIVDHFAGRHAEKKASAVFENDAPSRPFAERFAKNREEGLTHLEQLERSRGELPNVGR